MAHTDALSKVLCMLNLQDQYDLQQFYNQIKDAILEEQTSILNAKEELQDCDIMVSHKNIFDTIIEESNLKIELFEQLTITVKNFGTSKNWNIIDHD